MAPSLSSTYARVRTIAPDALVLDTHPARPHLGWRLLDLCRQDPALCAMPIVICSDDERASPDRPAAAPSAIVLRKPFDLGELITLLPPAGWRAPRGREQERLPLTCVSM